MHVSSAIIQQPLNSAIASPNNAASSQDDVVVRASAKELNDSHLCPLLDRFIQFNVAINLQGCDFSVDQFSYLGHKIASAGISPDPKRLSPADIPSFDDVHVLRFILGALQYHSRLIPNFSQKANCLFEILSDMCFPWSSFHVKTLRGRLNFLQSDVVLTSLSPNDPSVVIKCAPNRY